MTLIKIILTVSFLVVCLWAFRNRRRVGMRAGLRLGLVGLFVLAIAAVLDPGLTARLASAVGVTRGTDLVLYCFLVAFIATSIGSYFRFREQDRTIAALVRAAAINEALARDAVGVPEGSLPSGACAQLFSPAQHFEGRATSRA